MAGLILLALLGCGLYGWANRKERPSPPIAEAMSPEKAVSNREAERATLLALQEQAETARRKENRLAQEAEQEAEGARRRKSPAYLAQVAKDEAEREQRKLQREAEEGERQRRAVESDAQAKAEERAERAKAKAERDEKAASLKLGVAKQFLGQGKASLAIPHLQAILREHPDTLQAKEASELLKVAK